MKTMAEKAGLNAENLTTRSARKRMIQRLNDHEVPLTHIMQIAGHENVQSLNNYSSLSEKTAAGYIQHHECSIESALYGIESSLYGFLFTRCKTLENLLVRCAHSFVFQSFATLD